MSKRNLCRLLITAGCALVGVLLMAYPFVSNFLYEHRQQEVIYHYQQAVEETDSTRIQEALDAAEQYNAVLRESHFVITEPFDPDAAQLEDGATYFDLLNLTGDSRMGYIEIPRISVYLPIYHGTSATVLENGVGHLENTSLPVGGAGTHAVLSAHAGLSDKKLFTDLVLLEIGDRFYIHVLDRTLAYEVDQIEVVLPHETENLQIVSGEDYVTLVTCTPYGVNSHRLLVRGKAIPYVPEEQKAVQQAPKAQSPWMRQYVQAVCTGAALLAAVLLLVWFLRRRRRHE